MLMTHLYFGDPSKEFSLRLAKTLVESGADILEIGIPYTDPVCDGEVFQRACKRALLAGMTPNDVFRGIKQIQSVILGTNEVRTPESDSGQDGYRTVTRQARMTKVPIYLTSYYGPILKMGVNQFVQKARDVGVKGLIVPDLLLEEQGELRVACDRCGLSLIQFATVYSTKVRLNQIITASSDFIYCVSLPGVTGDHMNSKKLIKFITSIIDKKIYVGFGIKSSQEVEKILSMGADGVIVGSAIAKIYEKNLLQPEKMLPDIEEFIKGLKESTI